MSVNRGEKTAGHAPREFSRKVWHFLRHGGHAGALLHVRSPEEESGEMDWRYRVYIAIRSKTLAHQEARSFASALRSSS